MRSKFRVGVVMVFAVFAMSALGVASASAALPEFVFNTLSTGIAKSNEVKLETKAGHVVTCKASAFAGELGSPHELVNNIVKLTGCKGNFFGAATCSSAGAKAEEIVTKALSAKLVYINKASKETGLRFAAQEGVLAEFTCGLETVKLRGSVVGKVTPINTATETFKIEFTQEKGVQKPTEYEEEGKKFTGFLEMEGSNIEKFAYEQTGEQATYTMTWGARIEIKA